MYDAYAVAIQSNGKIVAAGEAHTVGSNFGLVRYNADGSLDTSFGVDGTVVTPVNYFSSKAFALAIQPDGRIVAAGVGTRSIAGTRDFALARYNTDGSLDTSFDGDGKVVTPGSGNEEIRSLVIQSDGKIIGAGSSGCETCPNGPGFSLARYNWDGSLDTSFGVDGLVFTTFSLPIHYDDAYGVALQRDGKIVATGHATLGIGLVRYNTDGSLDTSFDGDGTVVTPYSSGYAGAQGVAIQADGKIVVAGSSGYGITVARYFGEDTCPSNTPTFTPTLTPTSTNTPSGNPICPPLYRDSGSEPEGGSQRSSEDRPNTCTTRTSTSTATGTNTATATATPAGTPPVCQVNNFSNTAAITINDNGPASPYPSNITVSGLGGTVTKVTVDLFGMNHTNPDDVDIMLVSPSGRNTLLMSDAGGSFSVGGVLTFDDGAADPMPDTAPIPSGIYRPTNYDTTTDVFPAAPVPGANVSLSVFNGSNPNGTWSLFVRDDLGNNVGSIASGWFLHVFTNGCNPTPTPTAGTPIGTPAPIPVELPALTVPPGSFDYSVPILAGHTTLRQISLYELQVSFNPAVVQPASPPFDQVGTLSSGMTITADASNVGHLIISAFSVGPPLEGAGTLLNLKFNVVNNPGLATALAFEDYIGRGGFNVPGFLWNEGDPPATTTNGSIFVFGHTPTSTPTFTPTATATPTFTPTATATATATCTAFQTPISFSSATYTVDESQVAPITIVRNGSSAGTNTVPFATANLSAAGGSACTPGVDYISLSSQVTFNPGDTAKTVFVTTCGDSIIEGNETFSISLTGVGLCRSYDGYCNDQGCDREQHADIHAVEQSDANVNTIGNALVSAK